MKKVVIVGAGPGGLTAGMLLAHNGYDVHIFEAKSYLGGRNGCIKLGDFTFDIGPTFLMLPQELKNIFQITGRNIESYLDLREIEPLYRLRFKGHLDFYPSRDRNFMGDQIERLFPGDKAGYEAFLKKEKIKFDRLFECLKTPYDRLIHFARPQFIKALPHFDLGKSLYDKLSEYFSHEELKIAMTFQSKYLGMSPWNCPAAFTILSFVEHMWGIYHPIGGLFKISEARNLINKCDILIFSTKGEPQMRLYFLTKAGV